MEQLKKLTKLPCNGTCARCNHRIEANMTGWTAIAIRPEVYYCHSCGMLENRKIAKAQKSEGESCQVF